MKYAVKDIVIHWIFGRVRITAHSFPASEEEPTYLAIPMCNNLTCEKIHIDDCHEQLVLLESEIHFKEQANGFVCKTCEGLE